ncbi:MAG: cysteine synthase A [Candidatus Omnitrophota bacterium]
MIMIYDDITCTVGNTPLVRLNKIGQGLPGKIILKLESFNPLSSVKDRVAVAMINTAEKEGKIRKQGLIIEPTSGNTGIGLAFICACRGYQLILTMPENMSKERRTLLKALGTKVVLTSADKGMQGAVDKAYALIKKHPDAFMPQQFNNQANPRVHRETTAREIWEDTEGDVDIFVAGIGTGGTITGCAEFFKEKNKGIKIVGVEPSGSAVISGEKKGTHRIEGIGAGFIPQILKKELIDEIIKVSDEEAVKYTRLLALEEGLFAGISSGANVAASVCIAERPENKGKNIITILCDTGERYLSTWIFSR